MKTTDHMPVNVLNSGAQLKRYVTGFVLSIVLTLAAFGAVMYGQVPAKVLITILVVLALIQLIVQLKFFLHLGQGKDSRWNLLLFIFMVIVVAIVIAGSLWIMNNLNYNMSSQEMNEYMLQQSKRGF